MNNSSMIPCFDGSLQHQNSQSQKDSNWKHQLARGIRSKQELLRFLSIDSEVHLQEKDASQLFPTRLPLSFANRMQKGNVHDPLLLQVLAQAEEFVARPGCSSDTLQEQQTQPSPLLHKYASRVLLMLTGACAINCRYCFRREFPYSKFQIKQQDLPQVLDYLQQHTEVNELILSGGDPLIVDDGYLEKILRPIAKLSQIKRIRIHSRIPIVLPARITMNFKNLLQSLDLPVILVTHCNHPQEINDEVHKVLRSLHASNITLLNQAVLLKNINDDARVLAELSEKLFDAGVMPYYLHLLDKTTGTHQFQVTEESARNIMRVLLELLPGFLMPTLVKEIAGKGSKIPIDLRIGL